MIDDEITINTNNIKFWKTLALILSLTLLILASYQAIKNNNYYNNLCDNLEEEIKQKKTLWEYQCGIKDYSGKLINLTLIKNTTDLQNESTKKNQKK